MKEKMKKICTAAQSSVCALLRGERGESHLIMVIVVMVIVLGVAVIFRKQITAAAENLINNLVIILENI